MDAENRTALRRLAPKGQADRVELLRDYDDATRGPADVPDPYYGGPDGFAVVYDICEAACRGLLAAIVADHLT